jgi:3-oxoacyl-[acyl-carrier-protein] synthase-3
MPGKLWTPETDAAYHFRMDGPRVFRVAAGRLPPFLDAVLADADRTMDDVRLVVPHQASPLALRHVRRRLDLPEERLLDMSAEVGNTIAASIPLALCRAIETGRITRGDTVLLAGTGAGLSLGAAVLSY